MNRQTPSPVVVFALAALIFGLLHPDNVSAFSKKNPRPAAAAKSAKPDKKGRERASAKKEPAKKESARKKDDRREAASRRGRETAAQRRERERAERRAADKHDRASKNDRRASKSSRRDERDEHASKNDRRGKKDDRRAARDEGRTDKRGMSRRERLLEARREAERRRREEAERRAEAARQAAIARALAIARQRAADQALRDEAAANVLKDDPTGEDPEVRRVAVEALGNNAGTVVVMDPKDGRVYSVVNQDWALRRGFKPCSTVKLVTGLAGLTSNVINPVQTVNVGAGTYHLDLTESLAVSNNSYFQKVGGGVGFDRMMETARKLGLGQQTGINHLYESPGRLPVYKTGWSVNHMSSHGDDIEVTPIQLATMTSAIANGGTLLRPHLPRTPEENVRFKKEVRAQLDLPQEHLQRVIPGMVGAVNYGTAKGAYDPTQTVAGKTGSCIGQGSWLGLFTSFAPVHDPKLAVVVVTRGSHARGKYAAAIAGKVYRGLNHRFGNQGAKPLLANDKFVPPPPRIDARKAAILNEEEAEAEQQDAYVVSEAGAAATGAQQSNVQKTAKTGDNQPNGGAARTAPAPAQSAPSLQPSTIVRPRRAKP